MIFMLFCGSNQPKYYLLLLLMTIIVFLYLITEDIDHHINLHSWSYVNKLRNFNMKDLHVNCLNQLILVVHLPDVSVVNTSDY